MALVDLRKHGAKETFRQHLLVFHDRLEVSVRFFFIFLVHSLDIKIQIELFDLLLALRILLPIVFFNDLSFIFVALQQRLHNQPAALVVLDIRANLPDHFRVTIAIQIIVLDLEELSEFNANFIRFFVRRLILDTTQAHGARRREVERVERRLIRDNAHVRLHSVLAQVNFADRGGD